MALVPGRRLFVGVRDLADRRLVERATRDLQADRQPSVSKPHGTPIGGGPVKLKIAV